MKQSEWNETKSKTSEEENVEISHNLVVNSSHIQMSNDLYHQYRIYYLLNFFFLCVWFYFTFHYLFDRPRLICCNEEKVRLYSKMYLELLVWLHLLK